MTRQGSVREVTSGVGVHSRACTGPQSSNRANGRRQTAGRRKPDTSGYTAYRVQTAIAQYQ